jgi:hypothetical protein
VSHGPQICRFQGWHQCIEQHFLSHCSHAMDVGLLWSFRSLSSWSRPTRRQVLHIPLRGAPHISFDGHSQWWTP